MSVGRLLPQVSNVLPQIDGKKIPSVSVGETKEASGFLGMVKDGMKSVDNSIKDFEKMSQAMANGEKVNLHELMIVSEKAGLNLKLMVGLRNKVVEAYQEVMRFQI